MTDPHTPARPYTWNENDGWEHNVQRLNEVWQQANDSVNLMAGTSGQPYIDELAVLLPNREMAMEFIDDAVQHGWCFFNRSSDIVRTEPFGTVYSVEYFFLRHHGFPWRFELMYKPGKGSSPLHDALSTVTPTGFPLVHASFKPLNGETEQNYAWAQAMLNDAGYCLAQECRSTYGRFGYWRSLEDPSRVLYLKPRINLRDAGGLR